ncbi:MAG: tRNA (guanosine(46)-N7)-methyltransferase TrmB [Rickettsiales endosymbiont of Dermacentor nuttalli]
MNNVHHRLLSFGRRRGRRLCSTKNDLISSLLEQLKIKNLEDIYRLNNEYQEIHIEIGFGTGEFIANQAIANPHIAFIGCEPFINGIANLLKLIQENNINNIRIWPDDARLLLEQLPTAFIHKIFILFPDPWPKLKHHKRRLVNDQLLLLLHNILKENASILVATDHQEYANCILEQFLSHPGFIHHTPNNGYTFPPDDWIKTKYHKRAESLNINSVFLTFYKINQI